MLGGKSQLTPPLEIQDTSHVSCYTPIFTLFLRTRYFSNGEHEDPNNGYQTRDKEEMARDPEEAGRAKMLSLAPKMCLFS